MELKQLIESIRSKIPKNPAELLLHGKAILASVFVIGLILTFALAGNVPAQHIQVVDGQQYLAHTYSEPTKPKIGYVDTSSSSWSLASGSDSNVTGQIRSISVINFSGIFQPSASTSFEQVSKSLFVNLRQYPIMYLRITVTSGVGYGIRLFSSHGDNNLIPLWKNSDSLNHRKGTGQQENIQVNVEDLALLNIGTQVKNITELQLYVERGPSNATSSFNVLIQNFEFLSYPIQPVSTAILSSSNSNQTFRAVYLSFDHLPTAANTSWKLNKINVELTIAAPLGTAYQIYQLNGSTALQASLYHFSQSIATYDYSLYPKGSVVAFPDSLPPSNGFSIVIVAQSGYLSQVKLDSISFVFTPVLNQTGQISANTVAAQGAWWYGYLMFFLFIGPLSVALLLYNQYRKDADFQPWHLGLAVGAGILCRLALAPIAFQPFDLGVYSTSARGWFEFGNPGTSLGPTLPLTFFLYWIPYSFYALLLRLGFQDYYILGHQVGVVETEFLKAFPIIADLFVTYLILKFSSDKIGKLFAFFYLLNPLSIYVSSVWGQYEASTVSFIVLGFFFMFRRGDEDSGGSGWLNRDDLMASLSFVLAALIELVGLIPLAFLLIKSIFTRPFKIASIAILAAPVILLFVYPPEAHLVFLIFSSMVGASTVLLLSQPHTPYTILSNFPQVAALHPLVLFLAVIGLVFVVRRQYDLKNLVLFTLISFVAFLLFSAQQPQWWVFVLPLGLVYALVSEKYAVGRYMLPFGAMVAFLILSFTQGSGYMLYGSAKFNILPSIENAAHGIDIFTFTTTLGALVLIGYLLAGDRVSGSRPLLRGAIVLFGLLLFSFLWFSVLGASL